MQLSEHRELSGDMNVYVSLANVNDKLSKVYKIN